MKASFFSDNRRRLTEKLNGGVIVLSAYAQMQRGNDMAFTFEQEANFWWLTGVDYPNWWLIMDGARGKSWLVAPQISASHEIFDGSLSADRAQEISGVHGILSYDEAHDMLRDLAKKHSVVYALGEQPHAEYLDFTLNPAIKSVRDYVARTFTTVQDCRRELAELRAIKQPDEIVAMKAAIAVTIDAFEIVKKKLDTCNYEYEVEAEFNYYFRTHAADGHAYDPIVAGGKNACTLHYIANSDKLKKRQLLLMDIGARSGGYAADITRTYAYGEPTKRQIDIHTAVQTAQQAIINLIQPNITVEQYQQDVDKIMIEALLQVGLMSSRDDLDSYHKYFPHAISHGLGVDVHDSLGSPKYLQPGMVLTVEPGIYIPEECIGVRIEDDILVTASGNVNMSKRLSTDL
ncbi:MAG: putative Xaa-Pro aminopeptidase [Candidatus Saccharibacteria bacterium]|jgi:Xaa-Pro aminopeptidase|nr:putative Xaa-Pro aminopeptidase [Candidatus Saccharibacteria bacterium]